MKTITLKADQAFDALLSRLAARLETTRSAVIRDAVHSCERQLETDALRRQLRGASRKIRMHAIETYKDLDSATGGGLLPMAVKRGRIVTWGRRHLVTD